MADFDAQRVIQGLAMSTFTITRTNIELPNKAEMESTSRLIFQCLDGFTAQDRARWRRLWKKLIGMEPGEMLVVEITFPRSGPFHRRHMAIEQAVFNAQERFNDFEQFRYWLKVGAAWVIWAAGPAGGVVPIPKSISYRDADEAEFRLYHVQVIEFLRGPHAMKYLWRHLPEDKQKEMMDSLLSGFDE